MRQKTKQSSQAGKMVYMKNEISGYKKIAECFNNDFASVFNHDDSEVVFPLNQRPENYYAFKQIGSECEYQENS